MNAVAHGTVCPVGPITIYWGRSDLPAVGPVRLAGQFAQVSLRGRYVGLCWR